MNFTTRRAINAFMSDRKIKLQNTEVYIKGRKTIMALHGNEIAFKCHKTGEISITNCGWETNVTKERLNGIPGVNIKQVRGIWHLNAKFWNGDLIIINPKKEIKKPIVKAKKEKKVFKTVRDWEMRYGTMDVSSKPGSKLIYTGNNGLESDLQHANQYLIPGETYTLLTTIIMNFRTLVVLKEHSTKRFNSVHFINKDK